MKKLWVMVLLAVGLYGSYIAPMSVKGTTYVDSQKAFELYNNGVKFIDVRPKSSSARGKIKGAIELYVGYMTPNALKSVLNKDDEAVVYCNGQRCSLTPEALEMMLKWGYTKLYYYRDGYPAWEFYGLPVE